MHYTVGMNIGGKAEHVTVEADDALLAALKVKHENQNATITYVRKTNRRGDKRHPHESLDSPS